MLDYFVRIMLDAIYIGVFLFPFILFMFRLYFLYTSDNQLKIKLLILLDPLNIALEYYVGDSRFKRIYRLFVILWFITLLIGSFFLFYTYKSV